VAKKYVGFRTIDNDLRLHTAMIEGVPVLAFMGAELLGSGRIEEIRDDSVRIRGEWYVRGVCTFTYAE
jgi:hypothetical protein